MSKWRKFLYPANAYIYDGDDLKKNWERLHKGDQEPYPDANFLESLCDKNPRAKESIPHFEGDYAGLARKHQQAWRLYHQGQFGEAYELASTLGLTAVTCAAKSLGIYTDYLVEDEKTKLANFQEVIKLCEHAMAAMPDHANAHYFYAYATGRYSQVISVAQALAEGLGGKIKAGLEKTLKLQPAHAEAHIALGTFQAEVIDKVGSLVGGLTFGAKKESAVEHFETALDLIPFSAIARIEYANALMMLFGNKRMDDATRYYNEAAECDALEAMEKLDVERARAELE